MTNRIQSYLRALKRQLWLRDIFDEESFAEMESHLLEAVEAGLRQGLSQSEAEQQAIDRFGSVKLVARSFEKERTDVMQKILLALAILMGLLIAYVDSRPTWDDTG